MTFPAFLVVALGSAAFAIAGLPLADSAAASSPRVLAAESGKPLLHPVAQKASGSKSYRARFALCGTGKRITCVVDGDTFWLQGQKIRIADIDTPEVNKPGCRSEYNLGMKASYRLVELLNAGPFEVHTSGSRDRDIYGRALRVVVRDGHSLGAQLVSEGLARRWTGHRKPWCKKRR